MKILISEKLSPNKFIDNSGYLICRDAVLARTGKQQYLRSELFPESHDNSIIEIDRPYNEVFSEETLSSFENKPITVEHPDENVTPENYHNYSVGFVRDVKQGKYNGQDVILGTLVITDADIIDDIQNGIRTELSCGYDCDITDEENPKQVNIRGNHVALCEQGRAGIAKIIDSKKKLLDTNDYNAYLGKLGFVWLRKMASDKEKWFFTGNEQDFYQAVNTIRKEREELLECSSNDGSKTIIIVKPSALKKDSIPVKDEEFIAGSNYKDKNGNIWTLKEVNNDKLTFDINGKENIINVDTFKIMLQSEVEPSTTINDEENDNEEKIVIFKKDNKLYVSNEENYDKKDNNCYVELPSKCNNVELATQYLIKLCNIARENIIDATRTSIMDTCYIPVNEFPCKVDRIREVPIYIIEEGLYQAQYLDKILTGKTLEEIKSKVAEAILSNYKSYEHDTDKKSFNDSNEITFSNHFYEEVEKILKKKLKKYEKGTEDKKLDIKEDEYKKIYEEAKQDVMNEIEKQLGELDKRKINE